MAVFSTNQNRQFYVVTESAESVAVLNKRNTNVGATFANDPTTGNDCRLYLAQKGYGGTVRSDIIDPKSIMWVNLTSPEAMQYKLKQVTVTLSGDLIPGQDYILRVNFRQLYGMSDEDIYQKYGAVHAYTGMSKPVFYKEMIYSLFKNFSRVYSPLLDIKVGNDIVVKVAKVNGVVKLYKDSNNGPVEISTDPTNIVIIEHDQTDEWSLGRKQFTPVYFDVIPGTVTDDSNSEVVWGTAQKADSEEVVKNGYNIADLEYFCMGERGDQYRNVMWPKSIETKYLVDPAEEYYVLDIHYAYQGTCEDIQKSEKTMTIVSTTKALLTAIVDKWKLDEIDTYKEIPASAASGDGSGDDEGGDDTTDNPNP